MHLCWELRCDRRSARDLSKRFLEDNSQHETKKQLLFLKGIFFGVVNKIVPDKIVIQIRAGNAFEPTHKLLQLTVIVVDVLDMIDPFLGFAGLHLNQIDVIRLAESAIGIHLVCNHGAAGFDSPIVDFMQIFG